MLSVATYTILLIQGGLTLWSPRRMRSTSRVRSPSSRKNARWATRLIRWQHRLGRLTRQLPMPKIVSKNQHYCGNLLWQSCLTLSSPDPVELLYFYSPASVLPPCVKEKIFGRILLNPQRVDNHPRDYVVAVQGRERSRLLRL